MMILPAAPLRPKPKSRRTMLSTSMFRLMSLLRLPASPRYRPPTGISQREAPGTKVVEALCRFQ